MAATNCSVGSHDFLREIIYKAHHIILLYTPSNCRRAIKSLLLLLLLLLPIKYILYDRILHQRTGRVCPPVLYARVTRTRFIGQIGRGKTSS